MQQDIFTQYHTEHELLRLIHRLGAKDFSLIHGMIPLGSCTMKLNATSELQVLSMPSWMNIHPWAPATQCRGYQQIIEELGRYLCEITGLAAISFQPNSGAQGEYAGLMTIHRYFESKGETRNKVLIPISAHGTNPASASMAGYEIVPIACDEIGNIDEADLHKHCQELGTQIAALMLTYPSTHGVFEPHVVRLCEIVHKVGAQVYMDGANMNAQVGITSPASIGADVCHLNLHKTFCIPHGGGGPGMGPIAVAQHLAPFVPGHPYGEHTQAHPANSAVSASPYGSACLLLISYAFIRMMGGQGLRQASFRALLSANYLKQQLQTAYPILYSNAQKLVAHELIIDCKGFRPYGIGVEDIAKRLMDYGFHAPTIAFPVPHTMMIEPTESESLHELDRFCEAMQSIRQEIQDIIDGHLDRQDNPLTQAPHTAACAISNKWTHPYSRETAVYPLEHLKEHKFWPSTRRIDNAWGDRNLHCTCAAHMSATTQT